MSRRRRSRSPSPSPQHGINIPQGEERNQHHLSPPDLVKSLKAFFGIIVFIPNVMALVTSVLFMVVKVPSVSWWINVSPVSLALTCFLHHAGMKIINSDQSSNQGTIKTWCIIPYISTILQMISAATLLLFMGTVYMVVVLPVFLLVIALVLLFSYQTFICNDQIGGNWALYEDELKLHFNLSSKVVNMAFAGLNGTVIGHLKDPSNHTTGGFMASDCFLFYGVILGLLVVLVCTVPPRIMKVYTRPRVAQVYIPVLSYVALSFVVLAVVMAGVEILQQYFFITCFCIVAIAVRLFLYDNKNGPRPGESQGAAYAEEMLENLRKNGGIQAMVGLLMAASLKYGNESGSTLSSSWWFTAFVIFAVLAILNYTALMVFSTVLGGTSGDIASFSRNIWTWAVYLSIPSAVICAVIALFLHRDEFKNIF